MLFKEDWENVHNEIIEHYGNSLGEEPFVYIREGDNQDLYAGKINIKDKGAYRSAHYLIKTDSGCCIEVQVRTLYEEACGEEQIS